MKLRTSWISGAITLMFILLAGCQNSSFQKFTKPTETPVPPTQTATFTLQPTETSTPTMAPTATITLTPTPSWLTVEAGTITAPILLYHHVTDASDKLESRYNVSPVKFEEQMKWLHDNGYQTITVTALADLMRSGGEIPQRPVVITFDDGNLDVFDYAFPIMKKYGLVGTFYIVENYIDSDEMISTDQVKQLIQNGWEIGLHSRTHAHLTAEGVDLADEIRLAKLDMEEKLGVAINSFAYPFGEINEEVIRLTINYGFTSAVGLGSAASHSMNSIYYLDRIEIQNEYSMEKFIEYFPWSGPIQ